MIMSKLWAPVHVQRRRCTHSLTHTHTHSVRRGRSSRRGRRGRRRRWRFSYQHGEEEKQMIPDGADYLLQFCVCDWLTVCFEEKGMSARERERERVVMWWWCVHGEGLPSFVRDLRMMMMMLMAMTTVVGVRCRKDWSWRATSWSHEGGGLRASEPCRRRRSLDRYFGV